MKIIVLAGGYSPERDVSLSSGSLIANALMERGHKVFFLDPWLGIQMGERVCYRTKEEGYRFHYKISGEIPDLEKHSAESGLKKSLIGPGVLEACREADMVFIALHGGAGENGQIQAVLEAYGIPYKGSGYPGCILAMDKNISKILMRTAGVATPDWYLVEKGTHSQPDFMPCVVKPLDCGSSVGVTIVENEEEWHTALEEAFLYGSRAGGKKDVDFLMDRDGIIYCLEANTLPGMTPLSLLPQEAKAAGITYYELCESIVKNGKGAAL